VIGILATLVATPSPDEAAAERKSPTLPPPTTVVERKVLREVLRAPCEQAATSTTVAPPDLPAGQPYVVTAIDHTGSAVVRTGQRLAVVSGHPLVAFVTTLPFYRDISVGATGPDVLALERALHDRGLISTADRYFDATSASVVAGLYAQAGGSVAASGFILNASVSVPPGSRVASTNATVGDVVRGNDPLLALSADSRRLLCHVSADTPATVGRRLSVESPDGTIAAVAVDKVIPGSGSDLGRVEVRPLGPSTDLAAGELLIETEATASPVLAVPVSALFSGADGSLTLHQLDSGEVTEVPVRAGVSVAGYVEVVPLTFGAVHAGDDVVLQAPSDPAGATAP
jgi:hypothetical protein